MKTKETKAELSKLRQKQGRELERWNQSIFDLETEITRSPGNPENVAKLNFCEQEAEKCKKEMKRLNRGVSKQLHWVSEGFSNKKPCDPKLGSHTLFSIAFPKKEI